MLLTTSAARSSAPPAASLHAHAQTSDFAALSHGILARIGPAKVVKSDCAEFDGLCLDAKGRLVAYSTQTGIIRHVDEHQPEESLAGLAGLAWVGQKRIVVSTTGAVHTVTHGDQALVTRKNKSGASVVIACAPGRDRVAVALETLVVVISAQGEPKLLEHDDVQTAVTLGPSLVVCGSKVGRIAVHREGGAVSILHWHSSAVLSLCLADDGHLLSGGHEGVLVLWRLDGSSQSRTFLPRLGASLCGICSTSGTSAAVLLSDGALLQVQIPTLAILSRSRASLPLQVHSVVVSTHGPSPRLAVALENHRAGCLTVLDPKGLEPERVIDVAGRNPVSTADAGDRWRIELASFSPDGSLLAAVLQANDRRELRVLQGEAHALRVSLRGSIAVLATCDDGVAVGDGNCLRIFKPEPVWTLEMELAGVWHHVAIGSSVVGAASANTCLVWSRATGQQVASVAIPGGCLGMGFGQFSMFAWGEDRIVSLPKAHVLLVSGLRSACLAGEGVGALCGDNLVRWDGQGPSLSERVGEEWTTVSWGGEQGWFLRDARGNLRVHGLDAQPVSESAIGAESVNGAVRVRPLRDVVGDTASQKALVDVAAPRSGPMTASEWCAGVPSHLLGDVPPLVWPQPVKRAKPALPEASAPLVVAVVEDERSKKKSKPRSASVVVTVAEASSTVNLADVDEKALDKLWE